MAVSNRRTMVFAHVTTPVYRLDYDTHKTLNHRERRERRESIQIGETFESVTSKVFHIEVYQKSPR